MSIAILGGTFDPIHFGHLIVAEQAYNRFKLEKIIFMPAGNPPHKDNNNLSSAKKRYKMIQLATNNNDHFSCSNWEMKRDKPSYTVDTLRYFENEGIDDIHFIIGADSLLDIPEWREPEYLLKNAKFIVARRPSFSLEKIWENELIKNYKNNIYLMESILIDISSTLIKNNKKNNKSIRYLTPDSVVDYINDNKIYFD